MASHREHFTRIGLPKKRYPSKVAAQKKLPRNQYVYKCEWPGCGGWHRARA